MLLRVMLICMPPSFSLQELSFTPSSGSIFIPADSRINGCAQKKINCQKKFNSYSNCLPFLCAV